MTSAASARHASYGQHWGEGAARYFSIEGDFLDEDQGARLMPVPDSFVCPISLSIMADPVATVDGCAYEREQIERWFRERRQQKQPVTSPISGSELMSTTLMPLMALKKAIEAYLAHRPELKRAHMEGRSFEEAAQVLQHELIEKQAVHEGAHFELIHMKEINAQLRVLLHETKASCASLRDELGRAQARIKELEEEQVEADPHRTIAGDGSGPAARVELSAVGCGHEMDETSGGGSASSSPQQLKAEKRLAQPAVSPEAGRAVQAETTSSGSMTPDRTRRSGESAGAAASDPKPLPRKAPKSRDPYVAEPFAAGWFYILALLVPMALAAILVAQLYHLYNEELRTWEETWDPPNRTVHVRLGPARAFKIPGSERLAPLADSNVAGGSAAVAQNDATIQTAGDSSWAASEGVVGPEVAAEARGVYGDASPKAALAGNGRPKRRRRSQAKNNLGGGAAAAASSGISSRGSADPEVQMLLRHVELLRVGSPQEKRRAALTLQAHAGNRPEHQALVAQCGALHPLVWLLQDGEKAVQEAAAATLGTLAADSDNRVAVAAAGAVEPLVKLLRCEAVRGTAASALRNLAANNDRNQVAIARAGAIPQLVELLNDSVARVRAEAAAALGNLAADSANNHYEKQAAVARAGAVAPLVRLLQDDAPRVRVTSAAALRMLATNNPDNQVAIAQAGAIRPLVERLDDEELMAREEAAAALGNLAFFQTETHYGNQVAIAEAGAIPPLVRLLRSSTPRLQQVAAATLRNLAARHADNQAAIAKAGAIKPLVALFKHDDHQLREEAASALWSLARKNDDLQAAISRAGGDKLLTEFLRSEVGH